MQYSLLEKVDVALDDYANRLPSESLTFQSIMREDAWGDIAYYARGEGLISLAILLEKAEGVSYCAVG
jgi:hypothetical protein